MYDKLPRPSGPANGSSEPSPPWNHTPPNWIAVKTPTALLTRENVVAFKPDTLTSFEPETLTAFEPETLTAFEQETLIPFKSLGKSGTFITSRKMSTFELKNP